MARLLTISIWLKSDQSAAALGISPCAAYLVSQRPLADMAEVSVPGFLIELSLNLLFCYRLPAISH